MSLLLALVLATQAPAPPPDCTPASATRVTFEQIHGEWPAWRGQCVAVRGIWAGEALWRGEAAARDRGAAADPAARPDRIGLAASAEIERRSSRPDAYLAIGRLVDCATFGAAAGARGHYCVARRGPVLLVTDMYRRRWSTLRGLW